MAMRGMRVKPAAMSGNGAVLDVRREGREWVVEFMSEPHGGTESLWFHLECAGAGNRRIRFAWVNAHVCLGTGSAEAMANVRPVVRLGNGDWERIEEVEVVERRLGGHYVTFRTPRRCHRAAVAFCYPYGPEELQGTLKEVGGRWEVEAIGLTGEGRQLVRLHASPDRRRRGRPGAYVAARQHAGETPGSWVLDGIVRAVAAEQPAGPLRGIEWWVVPFVDLDGVVNGDYGKDSFPIDLNRAWAAMPMRPEVAAIQRDMQYFAEGRARRFVLDLHGPGGGETRIYQMHCRKDRPRAQREAARRFNEMFCAEIPEQPTERLGVVPTYGTRWDLRHNLSSWAWDELGKTLGVTIETAYQPMNDGQWQGRDDYREIGGRIARAAAAFLTRRSRRAG